MVKLIYKKEDTCSKCGFIKSSGMVPANLQIGICAVCGGERIVLGEKVIREIDMIQDLGFSEFSEEELKMTVFLEKGGSIYLLKEIKDNIAYFYIDQYSEKSNWEPFALSKRLNIGIAIDIFKKTYIYNGIV